MLKAPEAFFDEVRTGLLGPVLSVAEVQGCNAILAACEGQPLAWTAYMLATAYHETAHTLWPVQEMGGEAYFTRMYDPLGNRPMVAKALGNTQPGDGARYCGRGYPQLTGRANYAKAQCEIGAPFVEQPDLALSPRWAAPIMVRGMTEGWFTGRKLVDFLPKAGKGTRAEFMAARRIVNGQDKADLIADYAMDFQAALLAGVWSQ